jgi:gluconolactonase
MSSFLFAWNPKKWDWKEAVYRVAPDLSNRNLSVDNLVFPNGLAFSPDESVLYITDSRRRGIFAFDVLPSGLMNKQTEPHRLKEVFFSKQRDA